MNSRINKIFTFVALIEILVFLLNLHRLIFRPDLRSLMGVIVFATFAIFFVRAFYRMSKSFESPVYGEKTNMVLLFILIIVMVTLYGSAIDLKKEVYAKLEYNILKR